MAPRRESYNPLLKSYPDSDKVNAVSEGAEVLYVRLLAAADDADRYYGDPAMILGKLFTARMAAEQLTAKDISRRLTELESIGLLEHYSAKGTRYIHLLDRFKTLRKDVRPQVVFPEPDTEAVTDAGRSRNGCGPLDLDPDLDPEGCCAASAEPGCGQPTAAVPEFSEFEFPTTGKNSRPWRLTKAKLAEYIDAYPALDVPAELRKARQWTRDKARNRKTANGMASFLTGWLNRSQNRGGGRDAPETGYQKISADEFRKHVAAKAFKDGPHRQRDNPKWVYGTLRTGEKMECRDYPAPE